MSIVCRVEKDRNFTVMHNFHLRDKNISNKAKGLLSLVLSLPEDWDYSVKGLVTLSSDGYDSIKTTLKELEASGYLVRERNRDEYGHLKEMIYCFYEIPQKDKTEDKLLGEGMPTEGKPIQVNPLGEGTPTEGNPLQVNSLGEGTPTEGIPTEVNPHQLNTNSTNILNKQNKDTFSLTSRTREDIADELSLIASIENQIERHLSVQEKQICDKWCKSGTDLKLIDLAVKDNLFRGKQFKLDYVDATLVSWKRRGVKDVNAARKIILDKHVENLSSMASRIAEENGNEDLKDTIVGKNRAKDLKDEVEYLTELFYAKRYELLMQMVKESRNVDVLDYLPKVVADFIQTQRTNTTNRADYRAIYTQHIQSNGA